MAHIVASITVFVNAPPYLPRRYAIANADCPDALFLCRENGGQQVSVFLASSCLTPIRGFALFN